MITILRHFAFIITGIILRWPLWLLIGLIGRTGIFKTVFLVYPHDEIEVQGFCPNLKILRRFLSGRPTPAGLIMDGLLPMGFYLVIPDLAKDLALKKNRGLAETIVQRMRWIRRIAGARTIGLAGQLGPIFEKRHDIPMEPPLFGSIHGNIFSIHQAIKWVAGQNRFILPQQRVAVVGGGEMGNVLKGYLEGQGYLCSLVGLRYTRKGEVVPLQLDMESSELRQVDFVVNLMPKGEDFIASGLGQVIPEDAAIIDFSRPAIPAGKVAQKVYLGNRICHAGMRFVFALPGGWKQKQLPACSLPALVAALSDIAPASLDSFCQRARQLKFSTALVDTPAANVEEEKTFGDISLLELSFSRNR